MSPTEILRAALASPGPLKILELNSAVADLASTPDPTAAPLLGEVFVRIPLVVEKRAPRTSFTIPGVGAIPDEETALAIGIVRAYCAARPGGAAADAARFVHHAGPALLDRILAITPELDEAGAQLAAALAGDAELPAEGRTRAVMALAGLAGRRATAAAARAALNALASDSTVGDVAKNALARLR